MHLVYLSVRVHCSALGRHTMPFYGDKSTKMGRFVTFEVIFFLLFGWKSYSSMAVTIYIQFSSS